MLVFFGLKYISFQKLLRIYTIFLRKQRTEAEKKPNYLRIHHELCGGLDYYSFDILISSRAAGV